jgi:hypothetical protein
VLISAVLGGVICANEVCGGGSRRCMFFEVDGQEGKEGSERSGMSTMRMDRGPKSFHLFLGVVGAQRGRN